VAIDKKCRHLLADVACATAVLHGRLGQWHPRQLPQEDGERFGRRRAVHPSFNQVRPDLDLDVGRPRVEPTCHVAPWPAHDHRAELVARYRDFGHIDQLAVVKALESSVADEQLRGPVELVGQPTLADLDLAVDAAVGGVGVDLDHDSILQVELPLPLEVLDKYRRAERLQHHARWNGRHDPGIVPDLWATPSHLTSPSIGLRTIGLRAVFYFDFSIALSTSFAPLAYSFSSSGASL
jgi:hypothetical protein